jgi:hypothetical protein
MSSARQRVAVVVPVGRAEVDSDEEISYRHLDRHLGGYDRFLVAPRHLDVRRAGFRVRHFDDGYFGSTRAYSKLMVSRDFYRAFDGYEFVLIYHLDALVFSDQLLAWCDKGYDYIGSPWMPGTWTGDHPPAVGNGGFSLRKVASFLRVLESRKIQRTHWVDPDAYWARISANRSAAGRLARLPLKYLKRLYAFNNVRRTLERGYEGDGNPVAEDVFWSRHAGLLDPAFRVAPVADALRFGFEGEPRQCYDLIGRVLPFGCHAWHRVDRAFWEPFLESVRPMTLSLPDRSGSSSGRWAAVA